VDELAGGNTTTFTPTLNTVNVGVPEQEKGKLPARALPYELNVHASVNLANSTIELKFLNTGGAAAVFQVRSGNPADLVRNYTVEPGKSLADTWNFVSSYNLSVYGPNGFVRYFNGIVGPSAANLEVRSSHCGEGDRDRDSDDCGSIQWKVTNVSASQLEVTVLDAYTGKVGHAPSPSTRNV
jgi:phospholipase C